MDSCSAWFSTSIHASCRRAMIPLSKSILIPRMLQSSSLRKLRSPICEKACNIPNSALFFTYPMKVFNLHTYVELIAPLFFLHIHKFKNFFRGLQTDIPQRRINTE
jgi:hypothetical protein